MLRPMRAPARARGTLAIVTTVATLAVAACGSGSSASPGSAGSAGSRTSSSVTAGSTSTSTSTSTPRVLAIGSMAVGIHTDTYVDTSRSTPANGGTPGAPTRTMTTTIWYPAQGPPGAPGAAPTVDAPRDGGHGPYPVVVFAHGFAVTPRTYAALLSRWASAGYVVVAPALPLLSGDAAGGASRRRGSGGGRGRRAGG